jgi:predicted component of type VI protein secretion system
MKSNKAVKLIHEGTHQSFSIENDMVIGRDRGDLVFDHDPKLSGKHCVVRATEGGCAVIDLKSRTGVFVNGNHVPHGKACLLKPGEKLTVGDQTFTVSASQAPQATEPDYRLNSRFRLALYVLAAASCVVILAFLF